MCYLNEHVWIYWNHSTAADMEPPEGMPCDCGAVLYHHVGRAIPNLFYEPIVLHGTLRSFPFEKPFWVLSESTTECINCPEH